jgi:RNA-directed DNA polymerase
MIKTPIDLQELRRRIYVKAKTEKSWRFWGLYVHVSKKETLTAAYRLAKQNDGAPGIDGVTFEAIESAGVEAFLEELRQELIEHRYRPQRVRKVGIPKTGGKIRQLSIPAIRDRVVQGALKLILEPIFEADFQEGSYGYRPKRKPHDAIQRVAEAIVEGKTQVIDLDLRSYFDTVRHHIVLEKVAGRVNDAEIMALLKAILKATGKQGVPQGGVVSPLLSNLYLNEVDRMLEKAKQVTRYGRWTAIEYVRFADDLVVLVDAHPRHRWLREAVEKRLRAQGKKRTALLRKLKECFRRYQSQPTRILIEQINPILRGWVNYFAIGHSSRCFSYVRDWVERKIRRHLARARQRTGFGWKRWSRRWIYEQLGLFNDYRVRHYSPSSKAATAR